MKAIFRYLLRPRVRYLLSWLAALVVAALTLRSAWIAFDDPKRPDQNAGHTTIDFGGQWVMGRMLVEGKGQALYHRSAQRPLVEAAYPQSDEVPEVDREPDDRSKHDADQLMTFFMGGDVPAADEAAASLLLPLAGRDALGCALYLHAQHVDLYKRAIGGPLYPPVHALYMYPLAMLTPAHAYRLVQILSPLLALTGAWCIKLIAENRIWWPIAWGGIMLYPGFAGGLYLGQNAILTLTILVLGWACLARQRPTLAGVAWGLLAFKPVWALAFFGLLVLTGRWRSCLAMFATGVLLILITLPMVGIHSWLDWLSIGQWATALYQTDENWVFLSRDLISIPRRWLVNWTASTPLPLEPAASIVGWATLMALVEPTIRLAILRKQDSAQTTGPVATFVLLGSWFGCFHFMFYDVLLTALPLFMLLTAPGEFLTPSAFAWVALCPKDEKDQLRCYLAPRLANNFPGGRLWAQYGLGNVYIRNSMTLSLIVLFLVVALALPSLRIAVTLSWPALERTVVPHPLVYSTALRGTPWEIPCLMAIWLWCGWRWLREMNKQSVVSSQ